ncbi:MAG: chorismate synthase [Candidatus Omnitrophota bacterium]|nr:MAG: chorismate synthase [Candidatus Omnitrophota bacterium]
MHYLSAGESHGRCLVAILEGIPAGLRIDEDFINRELARRQKGYGRGKRMEIERDKVKILAGVKKGISIGAPIALKIENKDFSIDSLEEIEVPRPGHCDLVGAIKYKQGIRAVSERASARETAIRVAIGAVCKLLLKEFDIEILSWTVSIGKIRIRFSPQIEDLLRSKEVLHCSELNCPDKEAEELMIAELDKAIEEGDSLGGVAEVVVVNLPVGLGSYVHYQRRLDGCLAQALMSIPSVKGVEIGLGFKAAQCLGSQVHDEIFYDFEKKRFFRQKNNAGGLEGGVTNGEPLILRLAFKPIPTLRKCLRSVNIHSKKEAPARIERADVCIVPAGGVIAEAVVSFEIAKAMQEKFGGDSIEEMKRNFKGYLKQVAEQ